MNYLTILKGVLSTADSIIEVVADIVPAGKFKDALGTAASVIQEVLGLLPDAVEQMKAQEAAAKAPA